MMSEPEENPYATPLYEPVPFSPTSSYIPKRSLFAAAFFSLTGTSLAGGLFGIIGCIFGVILGFFIAAIVGSIVTVITFSIFALTSPSLIPRSRVIGVAALSGAITGFVSCWPMFLDVTTVGFVFGSVAATMGAAGAALFVSVFCRGTILPEHSVLPPAVWQDPE